MARSCSSEGEEKFMYGRKVAAILVSGRGKLLILAWGRGEYHMPVLERVASSNPVTGADQ